MNIVCVICSDRLTPSDDIFNTPCGHTFHFACLTQWLERSRTCPQCREKVTQSKIHRLYFNFSNNDTIVEDSTTLQAIIDSLKFQLLTKDQQIKQTSAKYETSRREAAGLRAEVKKLENELTRKDSAILAFKEQTRFFKDQSVQAENATKEVARLKKKLDEYRSVQILINAPSEDVDEMISNTKDPAKLLTYISVMKRELTTSVARRKELRTSVKKLQQELTKVSMERNFLSEEHEKRKQLEKMLMSTEKAKNEAEKRLRVFQDSTTSEKSEDIEKQSVGNTESTDAIADLNKKIDSEQNASSLETASNVIDLCEASPLQPKIRKLKKNDVIVISPTKEDTWGNEENSPFCKFKYTLRTELPKRKTKPITGTLAYSWLAKKPRLAQMMSSMSSVSSLCSPRDGMTFDGFGGHSKLDEFPTTKRFKTELRKPNRAPTRKPKLDDGNNRKLSDFVNLDP